MHPGVMHGEAVSSALPSAQLEVVSSPELARHGGSSIAPVCSARSQANRLGDGIMDRYQAVYGMWERMEYGQDVPIWMLG